MLAFLLLPIAALFLRVPPGELFAQLGNPVAVDALLVSLKTSLIAHVLVLAVGTPAAYLLATRRFRAARSCVSLIELPLIAAAGGRRYRPLRRVRPHGPARQHVLGARCSGRAHPDRRRPRRGVRRTPFYVRGGIAAFEVARSPRCSMPRARSAPGRHGSLAASPCRSRSAVSAPPRRVALARGLGEFGATIIFAGSLQGVTQTLPLAIYAELDSDFDTALAIGALFVAARRHPAPGPQACAPMDTLSLDIALPLRSFGLELALEVGRETVALAGPSGAGRRAVLRAVAGLATPERGSCAAASEIVVRLRAGRRLAGRRSARSATSSRTTRSSRT